MLTDVMSVSPRVYAVTQCVYSGLTEPTMLVSGVNVLVRLHRFAGSSELSRIAILIRTFINYTQLYVSAVRF